jgi:hypothetical protein
MLGQYELILFVPPLKTLYTTLNWHWIYIQIPKVLTIRLWFFMAKPPGLMLTLIISTTTQNTKQGHKW